MTGSQPCFDENKGTAFAASEPRSALEVIEEIEQRVDTASDEQVERDIETLLAMFRSVKKP